MAIYRFSATIVKRSSGRSATASAAYRAAEAILDERTGMQFDYTRYRAVVHTEILAPANAPDWMRDRAQLWNAVERAEKRKDAQLAREVLLALPHELKHDQRLDLVREFVRDEFVAHGMIADIAVHAPDRKGDQRNHHVHVLLTMRELTGDGFGNKARDWNDTEQLEKWREHWADAVNSHLERAGHSARVDHRSNVDQGLDREPEPKMGPVATEMERDGKPSHAGDDRRAAKERNKERAKIAAELAEVSAEIIDLAQERAKRAENTIMDGQGHNDAVREAERQRQQDAERRAAQVVEDRAREHADHQVRQTEEMREQRVRLDAFEADQRRRADDARQEEERKREAEARGKAAEGEIHDAGDRYRMALGQHYDMKDPYGSLARAAMAEYGAFIRDRQELTQQIAQEKDAEVRWALELRRDIEAADYMAITSHRIADQSQVITGRRDSEDAIRFHERAAEYETQGKELRQQYRDHATERARREAEQSRARTPEPSTRDKDERTSHSQSRTQDEQPSRSESRSARAAKDAEHELTKGREVTDDKAARIARIRENGRQFESTEKARQNTQSMDRGRTR